MAGRINGTYGRTPTVYNADEDSAPPPESVCEESDVGNRKRDHATITSIQKTSKKPGRSDRPGAIAENDRDIPNENTEMKTVGHESEQPHRSEEIKKESDTIEVDRIDKVEEKLDDHVYRHDQGELFAEDHMAVLPEVVIPEREVTIEDVQVGDPGTPLTEDQK